MTTDKYLIHGTLLERFLSSPVFPDEKEKTRKAFLLNSMLWTLTLITFLLAVGTVIGSNLPLAATYVTLMFLLIIIGLHFLLRQGRVQLASTLLVASSVAGITSILILNGTIRSPAVVYYLFTCVVAGLLIGRQAALMTAAISCIIVFGLVSAEMNNMLSSTTLSVTYTQGIP